MVLLYNVGELRKIPCPWGHGDSIEYIVSQESEDFYLVQVVRASDELGKGIYFSTTLEVLPENIVDLTDVIKEKYLRQVHSIFSYQSYFDFMRMNFKGELSLLEEELFLALDRAVIEKGVWHPILAGLYLFKALGPDAMKVILEEDCDTSSLSSLIMGMLQKCGVPTLKELLEGRKTEKAESAIKISSVFGNKSRVSNVSDKSVIAGMRIDDLLGYGLHFNLVEGHDIIGVFESTNLIDDHVIRDLSSKYEEVFYSTDNKNMSYISRMEIKRDYRRKGIGSAFMEEILDRIKERGAEVVVLQTLPVGDASIEDLIRFYKKFGFKIIYDAPTESNNLKRMVLMALYL